MPLFRCGGASLTTLIRDELYENIHYYCGDSIDINARWTERRKANIDGIGNSVVTANINLLNYSGYDGLTTFFNTLGCSVKNISNYIISSQEGSDSVYYQRLGILWRSADSIGERPEEGPGYVNSTALSIAVPKPRDNMPKYSKKMLEVLREYSGDGGSYTFQIGNPRTGNRKWVYYHPMQWLETLLSDAGYAVSGRSDDVYRNNPDNNPWEDQTSTFLRATYKK